MAGNNKYGFLIVIILVAVGLFFFWDKLGLQSGVIPESDNRIIYVDINNQGTQLILSQIDAENDKFTCEYSGSWHSSPLDVNANSCTAKGGGGSVTCITKKDFSRLQVFIRARDGGTGQIFFGNKEIPTFDDKNVFRNYEITPDNLNIGVYDVFINGEFSKRINTLDTAHLKFFATETDCVAVNQVAWEYIKYVPIESFTIRNDEVWYKESRGNSGTSIITYSFNELDYEMIGFHSQTRPATIRDFTEQTEVPAPQIYINLINNLPVQIQPNTAQTLFYRTKFVEGMPPQCKGEMDKVVVKQSDGSLICEGFVKQTPIIQQCQTINDCAILPECEAQKDLISCNQETHLCDYTLFSPACKNQLITFQEKVIEIEKTKFVPIVSGTNSFFMNFDNTKTSYNVGEKTFSVNVPSNICPITESSQIISDNKCFVSTLFFNGKSYKIENDKEIFVDFGIKIVPSISGQIRENILKDWNIVIKGTLPDDFLELKSKDLGNKFILQNSDDKVTFIITNKLGFGIDGGYTLQTQNLALEGGVVLRDEIIPLFLKNGDNDITYNFETKQLGTIVDIIGDFGKVTTDREYKMFSSKDGKQKFLVITKEVVTEIPSGLEKVQPIVEIVEEEKIIIAEIVEEENAQEDKGISTTLKIVGGIIGLFVLLRLFNVI